jgi:hypothetical protein
MRWVLLLHLPLLGGCALFSSHRVVSVELDGDNCPRPVLGIELTRQEFEIAVKGAGDVALARVNYKQQHELVQTVGKASHDEIVRSYLVCHAMSVAGIPKENHLQRMWFFKKFQHIGAHPDADAIGRWDKENPIPPAKPFALGKQVSQDTGGPLTTYVVTRDVPHFLLRDDSQFTPYLAPDGARFTFASWHENGYLVRFSSVPAPSTEVANSGAGVVSPRLVRADGPVYEIPREGFIQGIDFRYSLGIIHGVVTVPARMYENYRGVVQPLLGYAVGLHTHLRDLDGSRGGAAPRVTYGGLIGVGMSRVPPADVSPSPSEETLAGSFFGSLAMGFGPRFFLGVFFGWDHAFGTAGDTWKFQNKNWMGLGAGWNVGG